MSNDARQALGAWARKTLEQLARTIVPRGGPIEIGAEDVDVASEVARSVATLPRPGQLAFRALLAAWELGPLVSRQRRRFCRLSDEQRRIYTEHAAAGRPWQQQLVRILKAACIAAYTADPRVSAALGFAGRCLDDSLRAPGPQLQPVRHPEIAGKVCIRADVVVVGSGAGGAVMAKELAERGLSVVVVEEGDYFTRDDFHGPLLKRLRRLYRDHGLTMAVGRPFVPVPMGRAVGGTTVVNSGTCFRTPDRVLHEWESRWGIEGTSPQAMAPIFEHVEREIHVQAVPEELLGENARIFRRGIATLGLRGRPIWRNIEGCRGCGVCAFGCPSDAKQAMHLSYLPRAEAAGARIYARCRVRRILRHRGRAAGVEAEILSGKGREESASEHVCGRLTVRAEHVVLAAGAIYTPLLLMTSGLAPRRSFVGRGLRIHPAVAVSAVFDEEIFGWRGTLQPLVMDEFQESHGLLFEVTSPLPGFSPTALPGLGFSLKEALAEQARVASVGLFVADSSAGRVRRLPGGLPLITYQLNREDARKLIYGIGIAARAFFAAGARRVNLGLAGVPALHDPEEIPHHTEGAPKVSALSLVGFHPSGTAAMGNDAQQCPVDIWGETRILPGLYVADASVFPGCVGVNPQITVMAMATRIAWHLADRLGARARCASSTR